MAGQEWLVCSGDGVTLGHLPPSLQGGQSPLPTCVLGEAGPCSRSASLIRASEPLHQSPAHALGLLEGQWEGKGGTVQWKVTEQEGDSSQESRQGWGSGGRQGCGSGE